MRKLLIIYIIFLIITESIYQILNRPQIKILNWGPKNAQSNTYFNINDQNSYIWISTNKQIPKGSYLMWGGNKINITIEKDKPVITANIDKEYYNEKGTYYIQIISPETREKSNKIPFPVN